MQGKFFTLGELQYEEFSSASVVGEVEVESFRINRLEAGVFGGWQNTNNLEFRAGLLTGGGDIRLRGGTDSTSRAGSFREGTFQLRFRYDTVDNKTFPTNGQKVTVEYENGLGVLNSDTNYQSVVVDALIARSIGNFRLIGGIEVSDAISGTVPVQRQFARGSILSTAGLRADTELGESAARASFLAYRPLRFSRTEAIENPVFYGATVEASRLSLPDGALGTEDTLFFGSLFVAADTAAGPVLVGIGGKEGSGLVGLLSVGLTF